MALDKPGLRLGFSGFRQVYHMIKYGPRPVLALIGHGNRENDEFSIHETLKVATFSYLKLVCKLNLTGFFANEPALNCR